MFLIITLLIFLTVFLFVSLRFLAKTRLIYSLKIWWRSVEDKFYVNQLYKVPKFNENMQENQLYRKVLAYLNSRPAAEDSAFANLFSGSKSTEIRLILDENQSTVEDSFLGVRIYWRIESCDEDGEKSIILKIRRSAKRRILLSYFQHIHRVCDEIELHRREVRLFIQECGSSRRWRSTRFTHPATMETIAMDSTLKSRIKSDLETFLKSGQYYHRTGRVWKRSYLLYGPSGTGKSTFIAAMAKFLRYDIYELNLHTVASDSDLRQLLLQTTNKSLIVVEDLDIYLRQQQKPSAAIDSSGILNFMDGLFSSAIFEERIIVFTVSSKDNIDAKILRPGRIDVHIHFPSCDFAAFKALANIHLGLKDHKLFPQLEEIFQSSSTQPTQAEISEIMAANRSSPSRALKAVMAALQVDMPARVERMLNGSGFGAGMGAGRDEETGRSGLIGQSGIHPIKEIKHFYGLLRAKSYRKPYVEKWDVDSNQNLNSTQHKLNLDL